MNKSQLDKLLEIQEYLDAPAKIGDSPSIVALRTVSALVDLLLEIERDKKKERKFRNSNVEDPGGYEYD